MTDEFAFLGTDTADEWHDWSLDNATVDGDAVRIRRRRLPAYVDPRALVELPDDAAPVVDVDVDDCATLYLLRASGVVERYDADAGRLDRLGCTALVDTPAKPRALAVTADTIYVASAGGTDPDGSRDPPAGTITAIAKFIEQQRWTTALPASTPTAMTADADRVYVLLDRPAGGALALVDHDGTVPVALDGLTDPRDVAIDAADTGYVLGRDDGEPTIWRIELPALDPTGTATAPALWDVQIPAGTTCLAAGDRGELLVGRDNTADGEVTLFRVTGREPEPIASMTRDLAGLHLDARLYGVPGDGHGVTVLDARRVYATNDRTADQTAFLVTAFDSGEPATAWHRLTMGFDVGEPGVQVRVEYAATDDDADARSVDWQSVTEPNPHDALLEDAVGRFLWLRVELQGDRFGSPRLDTLRAYFPRQSYLRYLPAIYQDDPESRASLERFLSIFESTFVGVEEDLSELTRYLDPEGVPPAFLGWLESWLALDPDETWPDPARRDLLADAPGRFKDRGTPEGILALLRTYLDHVADPSPVWEDRLERQLAAVENRDDLSPADARTLRRRIQSNAFLLEYRDLDCTTGATRDAYTQLLGCPQCFFVFVRPFVDDEELDALQRLVDDVRPAHAVGRVVELEPSIVLGGHSYLGLNTALPDRDLVVGEGALGRDTVLDAREAAGQLAVRARLGEDTTLS